LEALERKAWLIINLIPKALCKDKEFFYQAAELDEEVLHRADPSLLADKDFLLEVISRCGDSGYYGKSPLAYASKELRNDRNVVLAAVKQDMKALKDASEELQNDPVVLAAYKISRTASIKKNLKYASEKLMNYPSFSIKIKNPWLLELIKSKDQSFRLTEIDKNYIYFSNVENPFGYIDLVFCPELQCFYSELFESYLDHFENEDALIWHDEDDGSAEERFEKEISFFKELMNNIDVIVENTTLIIYEDIDPFDGVDRTHYEDIYKELYPDSDDYWDHYSGCYTETREYDKKKGKQWSKSRYLEMY
jgi:hypothetical protein